MEIFIALFALSWWMLAIIGAATVLLIATVAAESGVGASLWGVATIGVSMYAFPGLVTLMIANPMAILGYLIIYLGIGTIWAMFRWFLFVRKYKEKGYEKPKASSRKDYIFFWMFFMIIDVFVWALSDMVRNIFDWIMSKTGKIFDKISDAVYGE